MDPAESVQEASGSGTRSWFLRGEFLYGSALFLAAALALAFAIPLAGTLSAGDWPLAVFFLLFGVFTISIGYAHPVTGYVSFDRVAQVSSILILGPVDAAWINGLASLLYPWHRLRKGVTLRSVIDASMTNAGLMTLMILGGGALYQAAGGPVPLDRLGLDIVAPVLLLLVAMQVVNEGGMMVLFKLRAKDPLASLTLWETLTELGAGIVAVLVAVVWYRMEAEVFVLLLVVLGAAMLGLKQFAEMRLRLERIVEARTEALREKTLELEHQATRDTLTGLFNRRYADEFLRREFDRAHRHGHALSIALADIDYFKQVNDVHSHAVGDNVLRRIASILAGHIRTTDLVARYGGEEFLFCLTDTTEPEAARICDTLRRAVESHDWSDTGPGLRVTISFGLAGARAGAGVDDLLAEADARLYRAKRAGRNRVVSASPVT